MQTLKIPKSSSKMFHINGSSLNKNSEGLEYLLKSTNINYVIIAISKTRTTKNLKITKYINLKIRTLNIHQLNVLLVELLYIANQHMI